MADKNNGQGGKPSHSKWGKGKTDPNTHFKKGCKPGPGRPKGAKNRGTMFRDAVSAKIKIAIEGKPTKMSKQETSYHQLANKAAGGDLKAIAMLEVMADKFEPPADLPPTALDTAADLAALNYYIELRQKFAPVQSPCAEKNHE